MGFWNMLREWFSAEPDHSEDTMITQEEIEQGQLAQQEVEWDDLWDIEREALRQESTTIYDVSEEQDPDIEYPNLEL